MLIVFDVSCVLILNTFKMWIIKKGSSMYPFKNIAHLFNYLMLADRECSPRETRTLLSVLELKTREKITANLESEKNTFTG